MAKKRSGKTRWVCGKRKGKKVKKSSKTGKCYYVGKTGKKIPVSKVRAKTAKRRRAKRTTKRRAKR